MFALQAKQAEDPVAQAALRCAVCGGLMSVLCFMPALAPAVFDTSYPDD